METAYRYHALENWLLKGIEEGRWQSGERLPSVRALCQQHQLSKATVQHALQRLEAQGLLQAKAKSGYYVTARNTHNDEAAAHPLQAPRPVSVSDVFRDIMRRSAAFDILPESDSEQPPTGITALNRAIGRALRRQRGQHHQYYDQPAGDPTLRQQIAQHQARRGWPVTADDLCITAGCQNALFLALMACCQPGDVVAVETPGFYGALQLLEQLGLKVVEVPSSVVSGMDMDALEEVLQRWRVRACIVSPAFATPTGALMPQSSGQRLLALAEYHDLAIIEDDIYADTGFTSVPAPLKAMDQHQRVILCSSFSKTLSRDLRLGWISGARWHERIVQLKLVTQLASSRAVQQGVADFMQDGGYAAHLRRLRLTLQQQRDQLPELLQQWPVAVNVTLPRGGIALWAELPGDRDLMQLYGPARDMGIVITPGPLFSSSGRFTHCLRISFAHPWTQARRQALTDLGQLLQQRAS
ncbi:MAG: GntR family transcriptional regulator [Oceanospirillaceae bacterium]|uniref:aminotransferase-like domain-containing protein n=1 Tax=unclassified Thalassolituus TaxID=2624967 RepID=UPI000C668AAE|nr:MULTISPECIES: PLP-dependent aminotransferase family protein [unclassified Thalassolituus]MAS23886.1 GntR family transcriptional regulator [Oceanospirillaceae bacterium]MBS51131.1 GntR family transcriptional regulator [Oceanospirillaceae bacterium]|tara:strand:+ start:6069 stop:7478 length:1410 start_codon:yes stop_codon:yes gene_type:complete